MYQKGLMSVSRSPPQLLKGIFRPPQSGTEVCENVLVPQTGKAVEGFCPGVVQTDCAQEAEVKKSSATNKTILIKETVTFCNGNLKITSFFLGGFKRIC